jgi:hypothetical protein
MKLVQLAAVCSLSLGLGAGPLMAQGAPPAEVNKDKDNAEPEATLTSAELPDDPRIQDLARFPFELFDDPSMGTEPTSADVVGVTDLPPDQYVPEVFQYRRRDAQVPESKLTGEHRHPALTEFRVIDRVVAPGAKVRVLARVSPPFKEGKSFPAEFWSQDYGRAAVVYVYFKPSKKDKTLYLGLGDVGRYLPAGRYNIGSTMVPDEHGHKKAYSHDFNPKMREKDGTPAFFVVSDNPQVDVTPPTLSSIKIREDKVAIGETVHVEMEARDDLSGPTEAEAVFVGPSGERSVRVDLIGSAREPGRFWGAFSMPQWYEGGRWTLQRLAVSDDARNQALLFAPTEPLMKDVGFEVTQVDTKVDREPPRLITLELGKREVEATETVPVAALAEDDLSGVEKVYVSFQSPHGADLIRVELKSDNPPLNRPSLVPQPNVFRGNLQLKPWQERGVYRVSRVNLADRANNYRNLNPVRDAIIEGITVKFLEDAPPKETTR